MRTTRELAELFSLELFGAGEQEITSVALNTAHVVPGSLFVAVQGEHSHGLDHLAAAIKNGAVAIFSDNPMKLELPNLYHPEARKLAGLVAAEVFETGSAMSLYAVTGTNGKTSTVFYLTELLNALGQSAGMISSAFARVGSVTVPAALTTPEAPRIHQLLSDMRSNDQSSAAIEASAQGLTRSRLAGLRFRIAGFTNLSRDHLDDYADMESYLAAKAKLFTPDFSDKAVVFLEDDFSRRLFSEISIPKAGIGLDYNFSFQDGILAISGKANLSAELAISNLMAKNLALALVMLLEDGYPADRLERALLTISLEVPGRLQRVSEFKPAVFVDYAHTPAAIESSAAELATKFSSLTILLAASGDRDSGKRVEMGRAAASYATQIIVTDQHPRSEDPAEIRKALIAGLAEFRNYEEIADPELAIRRAIELTDPTGAVLWCGPGHLKYREVKGEKLEFDAVLIARRALAND
jgi:UDP-N-acetylmuramoyl-L-alanyl-D-glutamate--2,6-diaminopimelate ligase